MPDFTITIVVPTYNLPERLDRVLKSLFSQTRDPDEIIISEDGEDTETKRVISKYINLNKIPIIHVRQEHLGYRKSHILNQGIRQATKDYIIFLDGDCVATEKYVEDHANLAELGYFVQGRRAFIKEEAIDDYLNNNTSILHLMLTNKMHGVFKGIRFPFPIININQNERGILGCNIAMWRDDLLKVNGFDEEFTGWGREDSDLGFRLYHIGKKRKFVYGRAIVYHLNHPKYSRADLPKNHDIFETTKKTKKVRCLKGVVDLTQETEF